MKFAPFSEGKLAFEPSVLQVHTQRHQGESLFRCPSDQLANLTAVQQKLAGAKRIVVGVVSMRVRTDVTVEQPDFAALDQSVRILEIDAAFPGGLDFGSGENDPRLEPFKNLVVVKGLTVDRDFLRNLGIWPGVATTPGVAPLGVAPPTVPGPVGCCGTGVASGKPIAGAAAPTAGAPTG